MSNIKFLNIPVPVRLACVLYWIAFLCNTDSYSEPYILIAIAGIYAMERNRACTNGDIHIGRVDIVISLMLSLCIVLANYQYLAVFLWNSGTGMLFNIPNVIVILGTAYGLIREIMIMLLRWDSQNKTQVTTETWNERISVRLFALTFAAILIVDCVVLFTCTYPGALSPDSIYQVQQLMTGTYTNHHPFYHTMIIKFWMNVGMVLFGDVNAAVATYSVFSITMMSACFAYVVSTIYRATSRLKIAVVAALWYLMMPFHIKYSYTMWKDIVFAAMVTLFAVSMYRILRKLGGQRLNMIIMLVSAFGLCLLRSNGWFCFVLTTVTFALLFRKERCLLLVFIAILSCSYILKHPVLQALNVRQPDTIESLSIPAQQIARVIAEHKELTGDQYELLSQVVDVDAIADTYSSYISDPVKNLVKAQGNQDYITENGLEYLQLWLELGVRYPQCYLQAFIDQTRGYWNAGYDYWRWSDGVYDNDYGITRTINSPAICDIYSLYCNTLFTMPGIRIFLCIGMYTWLTVLSAWRAYRQRNKEGLFVCVPFLMVVLSLCIATPVYSEFRYAYALFCAIPFILITSSTYVISHEDRIQAAD